MIGVLTILGYSLYDTVVVFDKVRENTRGITGSNRYTYCDATNLAVNQTIVRSINTTLIALLPVGSILVVGTVVLGTGPLKDLSLALFVGIAVGAYSSIFIAPALLATFKEREPGMQALRRRVTGQAGPGGAAAAAPVAVRRPRARVPVAVRRRAVGRQDAPRKQDRPAGTAPTPAARPMKATAARDGRSRRASRGRSAVSDAVARAGPERRHPRHPGLPAAGGGVQGHHPAAGRSQRLRPGGRGAGRSPGTDDDGNPVVDKVVGIEARGFILAAPVALALGAGFVPVRKKGKLPAATYEESYALEYGEATIEVHQDAFTPGDRVLVIDDVLATGGTRRGLSAADPPLRRRGRRDGGAAGAVLPAGPRAARRDEQLTALVTV